MIEKKKHLLGSFQQIQETMELSERRFDTLQYAVVFKNGFRSFR